MTGLELALIAFAVAAGAISQRVTGIGFALVSSPLLVLFAGPFEGVILANVFGLVTASVVLLATWRHVDWVRGVLLMIPALVAILPGAWVARRLPSAWLEVVIGALLVIALLAARARPHSSPFHRLRGRGAAVAAGVTSGFMNVTAGVGGPAIVLYALGTGWAQARFAATFQFYTLFVSATSVLAKGGTHLPSRVYLVGALGLVVGLGLGQLLTRRVSAAQASRTVLMIALLGAAVTLTRGLVAL